MTAKIIDGRAVAAQVRARVKERVARLRRAGVVPGLAVILVGDDAASRVYVGTKVRACREVGIFSRRIELPARIPEAELIRTLEGLNQDPAVHGILVQLPLPPTLDAHRVFEAVAAEKDVDGLHLRNVGLLSIGRWGLAPCTPAGILRLFAHEGISCRGQHAVVVGASNLVGKPLALMLLQEGATVTVCNSKTRDLPRHTRLADLLIVAVGKPGLVTGDMVKPGAVVIDVGINRLPDGRLTGDVDFATVAQHASRITPVPGGVGPMTVAMLLENTVSAAEHQACTSRSMLLADPIDAA
jgi:methylenetetrahydrofolate dehydrogenase (NADP+)/methenyltetrahydrofolate cyclohydrolase